MSMYVVSFAICLGLEWSNTMEGLSDGQKVVSAVFTSVTSRTTGLNVLNTGGFRPALLVFELIVFVISSNPNAVTMRATSRASGTRTATEYTKELLITVVAGLTLCWIVILLLENSNEYAGVFPVLFEVASAFGTIGLSLGFGNSPTSLTGCFSTTSKLVVMVLMLVGCHRTLPANVDPFVQVLSPQAARDIEMQSTLRRSRKNTFNNEPTEK
jgi:Trk-type K+ transport system membrane component